MHLSTRLLAAIIPAVAVAALSGASIHTSVDTLVSGLSDTEFPETVAFPDEAFEHAGGTGLVGEGWAACRARVAGSNGQPTAEDDVAGWLLATYPNLSGPQASTIVVLSGIHLCPGSVWTPVSAA